MCFHREHLPQWSRNLPPFGINMFASLEAKCVGFEFAKPTRSQFERYGTFVVQHVVATGTSNNPYNVVFAGGLRVGEHVYREQMLSWLTEQYDRQERKET